MTANTLWFAPIQIAGLFLLPSLVIRLLTRLGMRGPNFRGSTIPVGYGLFILLWSMPSLLVLYLCEDSLESRNESLAFAVVALVFGMLGFLDDRYGTGESRGLRGHILRLVKDRKVSSGLLKAVFGLIGGILISDQILRQSWQNALVSGAVIALSANALNLLDLRPGRAVATFLTVALLLQCLVFAMAAGSAMTRMRALPLVMIPAFFAYLKDRRAEVMLGDTGSNLLGAALGLAFVLVFPSLQARAVALVCLALMHVAAERVSFSAVIERNPVLRRLDALTGVR